jgi:formate hydrogenlyase subunit 3/multisubunit Na+/H+ antiporter MnhD subunit
MITLSPVTMLLTALLGAVLPYMGARVSHARAFAVFGSTLTAGVGATLSVSVFSGVPLVAEGGWRLDELAAFFVLLIVTAQWLAVIASFSHLRTDETYGSSLLKTQFYFTLIALFTSTLLFSVLVNTGVLTVIGLQAAIVCIVGLIMLQKRVVSLRALWSYGTKPLSEYSYVFAPFFWAFSIFSVVAIFSLLRVREILDITAPPGRIDTFFIIFGLAAFSIVALRMRSQKDARSFFAHAVVAHLALIVLGFGLGTAGAFASMLYLVGVALLSPGILFGVTSITIAYRSAAFENVCGVIYRLPKTGAFLLVSLGALLAVPPSPLFMSVVVLIGATTGNTIFLAGILIAGLLALWTAFLRNFFTILFRREDALTALDHTQPSDERWSGIHVSMALALLVLCAIGVWFVTLIPYITRLAELAS